MANPIVGKKFSLGSGPKPVVDKINRYFTETNSIAHSLNTLLDRFDHISFKEYSPIDDDLVEISKSLLLGKRGDNVDTIKYAFTRLSFTLKEYDILEKFGEREAPIFLLDHMLNNTTPNKPTFYCGLGLKKKTLWYQKKRDALKIDPIEKPDEKPGQSNDKSIVNRLSLELATRCSLAERKRIPHDPKKDPTMVPGRSPFYRYIKEKKKPLKVISDNTTAHRTGKSSTSNDAPKIRPSQKRPLIQPSISDKKRRKKTSEIFPTTLTEEQMAYITRPKVLLQRIPPKEDNNRKSKK